jgi:CTP synthase
MKYIFVSGGVVSGLGKGITSATIGLVLKSKGYRITNIKIDMYLNVDAGTIRPQEHGEVFVTQDGMETDQDLGNYERFTGESLRKDNYITTGQVYKAVIDRERSFGYDGEDVEAIPHVTDEITNRIKKAGELNRADIVIIELGGTVGEYQNSLFFEASRILRLKQPNDVLQVHVTYLPFLKHLGELKSKPAQQSTRLLNAMGIQPDFVVTRSERSIDEKRKEKLCIFCNVKEDNIIDDPDLDSVYKLPEHFDQQKFGEKILKEFGLKVKKNNNAELKKWNAFVENKEKSKKVIKIAMVGKYFATGDYKLTDSYISVIEAIKQAAWTLRINPELSWIDSGEVEKGNVDLKSFDGIVVPQGWGSRGTEGKIEAVKIARENKIPYLGLCFGMQMAVIEFARNVVGLKGANSVEVDKETKYPVIHIMPDQAEYLRKKQYGGTIRLGSWPCKLTPKTKLAEAYEKFGQDKEAAWNIEDNFKNLKIEDKENVIFERHRHRYEVNNEYREQLEKAGLIIAGTSPDGKLVEAVELRNHPFFVGTQFHPEYISRPLRPHPIFLAFVEAIKKNKK